MREFSLSDILKDYLKKFWIVIISLIIAAIVGFVYISKCFVPMYEESITIILGKSNVENSETEMTYEAITLYDSLINNYLELLESNKLLSQVNKELGLNYNVKDFSSMIDYTVYDSSQMINISVKNSDDNLAVEICNKLVEALKEQVYEIYGIDNITVVDKAVAEKNMVYSENKIFLICLFIGFVLSSAFIVIRFIFIDDVVKIKKVKKKKSVIPFLGKVIYVKKSPNLEVDFSEKEKYLFRNIRTKLLENIDNNKVIMISSVRKNKYKSYVSFNLARMFEKTNKKVVLIDTNAKDGLITSSFLKENMGILEAIENIENLNKVKCKIDNIDVIPLGNYDKIDLLLSKNFKEVLNILREEYDYIFIDVPAYRTNFEFSALLELVDGLIFVLKHNGVKEIYSVKTKKCILGGIEILDKKAKEDKFFSKVMRFLKLIGAKIISFLKLVESKIMGFFKLIGSKIISVKKSIFNRKKKEKKGKKEIKNKKETQKKVTPKTTKRKNTSVKKVSNKK